MKIDTVIDIARCKKTAVHTRLAHVLVGYKRMWGEETIEEMNACTLPDWITLNRNTSGNGEYGCYRKMTLVPNGGRKTYHAYREILAGINEVLKND
jgi:hypothetical protein|tara:strand:- start:266 stop:553 length:288 start_codon:yes stop_codon:yes gene_type:complete